ncbi:hypothetical protein [Mycolicibacterium aubagnense]|nr:hypothetical protein [Mycolicibacterium aubagnense]
MPDYLITFHVSGAADEADALATCADRLSDGRDFYVEKMSD